MRFFISCSVFVFTFTYVCAVPVPLPLRLTLDREIGSAVVQSVVDDIGNGGGICNGTGVFLRNLAYVESHDGLYKNFGEGHLGGIWKIRETELNESRQCGYTDEHQRLCDRIRGIFNITWEKATFSDLDKPLCSGLAAYLYLKLKAGNNTSGSLLEQSRIWSQYLHPGKAKEDFINSLSGLVTDITFWTNKLSHPYPEDKKKYIICTSVEEYKIVSCPTDMVYHVDSERCIPENFNPCTVDVIQSKQWLHPYPKDHLLYYHCDDTGHFTVQSCGVNFYFDKNAQRCYINFPVLG